LATGNLVPGSTVHDFASGAFNGNLDRGLYLMEFGGATDSVDYDFTINHACDPDPKDHPLVAEDDQQPFKATALNLVNVPISTTNGDFTLCAGDKDGFFVATAANGVIDVRFRKGTGMNVTVHSVANTGAETDVTASWTIVDDGTDIAVSHTAAPAGAYVIRTAGDGASYTVEALALPEPGLCGSATPVVLPNVGDTVQLPFDNRNGNNLIVSAGGTGEKWLVAPGASGQVCSSGGSGNEVIFSFTGPATGTNLTFSTNGSTNIDTLLALVEDDCTGFTQECDAFIGGNPATCKLVACNDDIDVANSLFGSEITYKVIPGKTYFLILDSSAQIGSPNGTGTINVTRN